MKEIELINIGENLTKDSFSKELSDLGLEYSEAVRISKCKKYLKKRLEFSQAFLCAKAIAIWNQIHCYKTCGFGFYLN